MNAKKSPSRPLPRPNIYVETEQFWEAAKLGKLLLQYCADTKKYQWPPRPVSAFTGLRNIEWREASGEGELYSWTNTIAPWPGHEDRAPYLCAIVELKEGVRIVANLADVDPDNLKAGMVVKVAWEKLSDDYYFPYFTPA